MAPTLEDGQWVLIMPPFLHRNRLRRGDLVVLSRPSPPYDILIKRVVGLPDESIMLDGGRLYVDDLLWHPNFIPAGSDGKISARWWNGPNEYFVMGDNSAHSTDSRAFGPVGGERIIGRVWFRVWPPTAWGRVR